MVPAKSVPSPLLQPHPHEEPSLSTIFIGGSRHVSRLSSQVRERINNVMNKEHDVVVGDANGADKAVQ